MGPCASGEQATSASQRGFAKNGTCSPNYSMSNSVCVHRFNLKLRELTLKFCHFSLGLQREQYLRDKKMGSDAYRKALDVQVKSSIESSCFISLQLVTT